ncbi:hypothetical protein GCM10023082_01190 [Streptomyces tremellae]|uniref:Uncharacterized protein n=1 Tax=Streptomyces tremellae TaxID=1124239 RepID=A0ABP7DRE8_9ACTN
MVSRPCTAGPLVGSASNWAKGFPLSLGSGAGKAERRRGQGRRRERRGAARPDQRNLFVTE